MAIKLKKGRLPRDGLRGGLLPEVWLELCMPEVCWEGLVHAHLHGTQPQHAEKHWHRVPLPLQGGEGGRPNPLEGVPPAHSKRQTGSGQM